MKLQSVPLGSKYLNVISCTHFGNASAHYEGSEKFIEDTKKLKAKAVHLGDLVEGIAPNDKRFSTADMSPRLKAKLADIDVPQTILAQISYSAEWMKKLNGSWLGLIEGNHESVISSNIGRVAEMIAALAKVPYLGSVAMMQFRFPKGTSSVYMAHPSFGFGGRVGDPDQIYTNKSRGLRNRFKRFTADLHLVGHAHQAVVSAPLLTQRMTYDGQTAKYKHLPVSIDHTWYLSCPSLLKVYDTTDNQNYAERHGYDPADLGWFTVCFDADGSIPCVQLKNENAEVVMEYAPQRV